MLRGKQFLALLISTILAIGSLRVPVIAGEYVESEYGVESADEVIEDSNASEEDNDAGIQESDDESGDQVNEDKEAMSDSVEESITSYTVTLDANGGCFLAEWDDVLKETVETTEILNKLIPIGESVRTFPVFRRQGQNDDSQTEMVFAGWSLERNGEIVSLAYEEYFPLESCILYATWKNEANKVENSDNTSESQSEDSLISTDEDDISKQEIEEDELTEDTNESENDSAEYAATNPDNHNTNEDDDDEKKEEDTIIEDGATIDDGEIETVFSDAKFAYSVSGNKLNTNYSLSGNGGEDIYAVANAQRGKKYPEFSGFHWRAWCADFVSACAVAANVQNYVPGAASVADLRENIKNAGGIEYSKSQIKNGEYIPKRGDIIIFKSNGDSHVGIVDKLSGSTISYIDGNNTINGNGNNSCVNYSSRSTSYAGFTCVISPVYNQLKNVDLGADFYAYIINTETWTHVTPNLNGANVYVSKGDADEKVFRFVRQNDGSYKITAKDGRCIEVHNYESANGTAVELNNYNGNTAQRWFIYGESGAYKLVAVCGSNCMDMAGGSSEDGTRIQMWESNNTYAQKFQIWKVSKVESGWVGVGAGTNYIPTSIWWDAGANVQYYDLKIWRGTVGEGEAYKILWNLTDTSCVINLPSGYYEGYIDYRNGYSLEKSQNNISFTVGEGQPVDIGDGIYAVILVTDTWKDLSISNGNVQLSDSSDENVWKFERQSDCSYVIRSVKDNRVLETEGVKDENKTNVQVYPYNGGDNQRWYIYGRWSGEYYLRPKSATRVLDVYGGENKAGDNLNLWDLNYSNAQKFAIYKLDPPGKADLTCSPGTGITPTEFHWNQTTDTKSYSVRIYKGEHWAGENIANVWDLTDTSCAVQLPAGDYEAYVDSCNSYSVTMGNVIKFSVGKASLTTATVTGISNKTYTGSTQAQTPIVKIGSTLLALNTDYSLSYSNNINAGTATVTITGKGNCTGNVDRTFTINAASIANATVTGISNKIYNGSAQTQNPTVKVGDKTLANGTDYMLSYTNNTNIGTATVTITGKGNYTGTLSRTFTIGGISIANATVTGVSNKTYNGSAQTQNPIVKVGNKTLTSGTDYTLSYSNNTNAGTATVTITGKGNYAESVSKTFTISAASIANANVTGISNKTYNGSAQTQNPTVKVGDKTLANGTDYTLSYSNNTNVGTATVTITGKGNYAETISSTFTINVASITNADVTGITNKAYIGSAQTQNPTVKIGDRTLVNGTDYTLSYSNNTNVGTATVTITGKGNYTGTVSRTFAIGGTSIANATVTGISNKTYNGSAQTQNPTVKVGDKTLAKGTDYTLSYSNNINAGTATVTIAGKGNYTESLSKTFTISAASIVNATVTGISNKTYNSSAQTQNPTVKVGDKTLANGTDYTLSYSNNINAGTATITITGKGNYAESLNKTFTVGAASIANADITGISNKAYTGSAQTQNPTVKVEGRTLTNGTDYTLSYSNNTNAGTATVTITGKGNYTGTVSRTFSIGGTSIANATVTGISNKTYNGSAQTQNPTIKVGDKTLANGTDYTLSYSNNINAGTATVTIAGKGNYTELLSKTFTISAASIVNATVTGISNKTYNGSAQMQAPTAKVGDKTLTNGTDYTLSYSNNTNAGTATVTITGKGNYAGTVSKTFTISTSSIANATVTGISNKTYNGSAQTQNPTVKVGDKTLTNGTDYTLSYLNNTNAGTATVTITGKGNYSGSLSKTFAISAASIANADVTEISNKAYTGSAQTQNPTVKIGDKTLVNGTDYSLAYSNNTNAGTATVTIIGKGNYTGSVSRAFTIGGISIAAATVTGISNKTYNGTAQTQNPTITIDGKTLTIGTDYTLSYANNTNVGTATVTITGKGNYAEPVSKTFMINAASIANADIAGISDKAYTGSAQTQNPTVKIGDRTLENGTDYTLAYSNNTNVGTATVTITGKGNYTGTVSRTFTIGGISIASATVTGISNRTYNGSAQTQNPTVKIGDKTLTNETDYTLFYANNTNAGTATMMINGKGSYAGTVSKSFTISAASISDATVTGVSNKTYNGAAQTQNPAIKFGNMILVNGTDYTLSYANNTNIGTATVTIAGNGNFSGTLSRTFTIGGISIASATVTGIANKTFNGSAQTQNLTVKAGSKTLKNGTDYTLSYANNTKAGTATVTITGKGNYTGTLSKNFTISAASIVKAAVTGISNKTYNGAAQTQKPSVKVGGKTLKNGNDYKLSYAKNKNVGTATVTITGKGNYTGTVKKTFLINPKPTKLSKLTAGSKQFTVKWAKQASQTTGYQIQYSSRSDFKSQKTVTVSGAGKTSKSVSGLLKKQKYYVRVRTYKIVGKKKYYSTWSAVKTVMTK